MQDYTIWNLRSIPVDEAADRIELWVQSHGIQTAGLSVGVDPDTGNATITVTADQDPTTVLQTYQPTPTPRDVLKANALADAKPIFAAIIAKDRATRTPVEKALLGLAVLLRDVLE